MANHYFQFKAFTIYQDKCAMKVTTDACLFGAVAAAALESINEYCKVLDIGTGTGLLALMLAQKNNQLNIDAVEIDQDAFEQASSNVKASIFSKQINVFNDDIKSFDNNCKYNIIISNPPFFENDLKSVKPNRNKALHDTTLTLNQLLIHINRLAKTSATFIILLPAKRELYFIAEALKLNWNCVKQIKVCQTAHHVYFRSILFFSRENKILETSTLIIKEDGNYTNAFKTILKAYYLLL